MCGCGCGGAFGCSFDNEHWAKKFALLYIHICPCPGECVSVCVLRSFWVAGSRSLVRFGSVARFRFISWTVVSLTLKQPYTTRMSTNIYPIYTHTHTHICVYVCVYVCFAAPPNAELDLYVYNKST